MGTAPPPLRRSSSVTARPAHCRGCPRGGCTTPRRASPCAGEPGPATPRGHAPHSVTEPGPHPTISCKAAFFMKAGTLQKASFCLEDVTASGQQRFCQKQLIPVKQNFLFLMTQSKRGISHSLSIYCKKNKLALLWGEAQLCLPYVCLKKEK